MRRLVAEARLFAPSFWNFEAACQLVGARYPTAPLGLITVGAMLPSSWALRSIDCNVQTLTPGDIDWADLVSRSPEIAITQSPGASSDS